MARTWTTRELHRDFHVHGFVYPWAVVTRVEDGVRGSLRKMGDYWGEFQHSVDRAVATHILERIGS